MGEPIEKLSILTSLVIKNFKKGDLFDVDLEDDPNISMDVTKTDYYRSLN